MFRVTRFFRVICPSESETTLLLGIKVVPVGVLAVRLGAVR